MRKTLNTAGDQRIAQADAPNAHGPLENGRTCGYNGGTAQALGSAVLSGRFTLHRGMAGGNLPCPAADCASFLYYTAVFQNMQQGFFGFLGFAPPSGSLRGGNGGGGGFFDYMAPSCRERRPRRSAQQNIGFRITSGESAAAPLPAADAPTNADVGRIRKRVADSPNVVPCRGCCCTACRVGTPYNRAGSDSPGVGSCLWRVLRGMSRTPSPTGGTDADSPGACPCRGCCCAACRVGTPYNRAGADLPEVAGNFRRVLRGMSRTPSPTGERLWIRRRAFCVVGAAARNAGDGVPYRAGADLPEVAGNLRRVLRGMSGTPSPTGVVRIRRRLVRVVGVAARKGQAPSLQRGWVRIRRGFAKTGGLLCGVPGSARPTGVVRIRPAMFCVVGVCRAGTRPSWFCPGRL